VLGLVPERMSRERLPLNPECCLLETVCTQCVTLTGQSVSDDSTSSAACMRTEMIVLRTKNIERLSDEQIVKRCHVHNSGVESESS
jgi:hypothetical protein